MDSIRRTFQSIALAIENIRGHVESGRRTIVRRAGAIGSHRPIVPIQARTARGKAFNCRSARLTAQCRPGRYFVHGMRFIARPML
jgi:hypothetical protein